MATVCVGQRDEWFYVHNGVEDTDGLVPVYMSADTGLFCNAMGMPDMEPSAGRGTYFTTYGEAVEAARKFGYVVDGSDQTSMSKLISVECILSRTSRCQLVDGKLIDIEYPSHLWSGRLDDGNVFMHPQMLEVLGWVLERTDVTGRKNVLEMFQRVTELAAQQPNGHNR